jgi:hypothetical protein
MTHRYRVRLEPAATFLSGAVLVVVFGLAPVPAHPMMPDIRVQSPADAAGRAVGSVQAPPTFRAGVDLVMLDVQVVAAPSKPVPPLTASQFEVTIEGRHRTIVTAEFLHVDEGRLTRGHSPPNVDKATRAVCVFGFERGSNSAHAHYALSVESIARDKTKVEQPRIKCLDRSLSVRRVAWRSRVAPAGAAQ